MSRESLDDIIEQGERDLENGDYTYGEDLRDELEREKERDAREDRDDRDTRDDRDADDREERDEPDDRDER